MVRTTSVWCWAAALSRAQPRKAGSSYHPWRASNRAASGSARSSPAAVTESVSQPVRRGPASHKALEDTYSRRHAETHTGRRRIQRRAEKRVLGPRETVPELLFQSPAGVQRRRATQFVHAGQHLTTGLRRE